MTSVIQIASNAVAAVAIGADRDTKLLISDLLSYSVEGYEFSQAFKSGHWDGRSSFFQFREGVFPAGFVQPVTTELRKRGLIVQLIRKPLPAPLGPVSPIVDGFGNDDPRYDYQMETVERLLKNGIGIARVATGGGKSKIAKLAVARIRRMTLFLTTRSLLMYQMKGGFEEAGFKVGVLGDGEWTPCKGINVAMVQTLAQRVEDLALETIATRMVDNMLAAEQRKIDEFAAGLAAAGVDSQLILKQKTALRDKLITHRPSDESIGLEATRRHTEHHVRRRRTIAVLEMMEVVIGEEAHEVSGNSFTDVLQHCRRAAYRLALTATPFMKGDAEADMRLMAAFGPIIIEVSEKTLIDRGILATPYFKFISTIEPPKVKRSTPWPRAYKFGIVENETRNRRILFEAVRGAGYGLSVMILVQQKAHGRLLEKMLTAAGARAEFIFGEDTQAERAKALRQLKTGKLEVLIGSNILDVGVDVPAVGMVILAGGGKAEVQHRQRVGRGLREKKPPMPNVAFIVDFTDEWNAHTRDHARTRQQILADTPGFAERILPAGRDFDFTGLGLTAKAA